IADAGPDFQAVCLFAGFHPETVRKHALEFIYSGNRMPRNYRSTGPSAGLRRQSPCASIAAIAGVSSSAVRKVLNEDSGSPAMKARVHKAARKFTEQQALTA